jgi:plasmid replication initiation protein
VIDIDNRKWYINFWGETKYMNMKKIETNNLIVKSNYLIEAPCKLSVTEQKIIYSILRKITRYDDDFKDFEFDIDYFIKELGIKGTSKYTELKQITRQLRSRTFTIKFNDGKLREQMGGITEIQTGWIINAIYKAGEGKIVFHLDPFLKPFLLNLSERFTELDYSNLIQLKSTYSTQIYELLKQYQNIGERKIDLYELKSKLSIFDTEYKLYAHFKSRVLIPAQKELNEKTDISFDFEEIKKGRKVIAIKFVIKSRDKSKKENQETLLLKSVEIKNLVEEIQLSFQKLYNGNLIDKFIIEMIDKKGVDHVNDCLKNYKKYIQGRTIANIAGDFYTFVMNGYEKPIEYKENQSYANFDQRKYTEEDFEYFYDNLNTKEI